MISAEDYVELFDTATEETLLLSALIRNPKHAGDVIDLISPDELGSETVTAELWMLARRMCDENRTPYIEALRREAAGCPNGVVMRAALDRAVLESGDLTMVSELVTHIREARIRERVYAAGGRMQQAAATAGIDLDQVREGAWAAIAGTEVTDPVGPVHIGEAMGRFVQAQRSVSADRIVRTPWPALNDIFGGGLYRQNMYTVGGLTNSGKSHVGMAMAGHAAEKGSTTIAFSQEMSELEVTGRWFSRTARVKLGDVQAYRLSVEDRRAAEELIETTDPLFIVDRPGISATGVHSMVRRFQRHHEVRLVVVDYLQLLEAENPRADRHLQVGEISTRMHRLSRELDVAVLMLAQLNRAPAARPDKRPRMTDLRESGRIEQDSSAVVLIYHHEDQVGSSMVPTGEVELIVDKNRHGRTGSVSLEQEFEYADLR